MSIGTQVELDWTEVDAAPGGASTPLANGPGSGTGAYLTDEEILGLEPVGVASKEHNRVAPQDDKVESVGARHAVPLQTEAQGARPFSSGMEVQAAPVMPEWMVAAAGDPKHGAEAQRLWREHQAFRSSFSSPDEARAMKELFPGGAGQAQTVSDQTPTLRGTREGWGTQPNPSASQDPSMVGRTSPVADHSSSRPAGLRASESPVTDHQSPFGSAQGKPVTDHPSASLRASQSPQFDPAAYAAFEHSTNDTVARDVRVAVGDTLARVLPEGIAEGAARRIGEDIFNEIHRTLAADRMLSEQVGEILRGSSREFTASGWRFGTAEQQRVAALLAGRAKQLVPGVSRRVIGEWTSSVLGASRSKAARQASAASRVDIAAPGGSLDSMPLRAMSSREINYASMSDDEILSL